MAGRGDRRASLASQRQLGMRQSPRPAVVFSFRVLLGGHPSLDIVNEKVRWCFPAGGHRPRPCATARARGTAC